jgi:hypothetical protein
MKDKSYSYYSLGAWDCDYPDEFHEEYICKSCKISYVNDEWNIPSSLVATEKQIKTAKFIQNVIGGEALPPLKKNLWRYIHDNLQRAIELNEKIKSFGFENLDFNGNLGHTIEKDRNNRIYFEKDNDKKLTENMLFTFEPHIRMIGKKYGFKFENIYYFENGSVREL